MECPVCGKEKIGDIASHVMQEHVPWGTMYFSNATNRRPHLLVYCPCGELLDCGEAAEQQSGKALLDTLACIEAMHTHVTGDKEAISNQWPAWEAIGEHLLQFLVVESVEKST